MSRNKFKLLRIARQRYPDLDLVWDYQNNRIRVLGGKQTNVGSLAGIKDYSRRIREQYHKFEADIEFQSISPQVPIPTIERPETSVSSWPLPGSKAEVVLERPNTKATVKSNSSSEKKNTTILTMPPKRRRQVRKGKPTARSRRYRLQNAALRPTRLPFKQVFPMELRSGYFDIQLTINSLVPELLTVYEEIRITSLSVVFLTKDVSVTAGLYTAILLDQDGYGTPLKSTSTWFKRVSDMRGSIVHHAVRGFRLSWKPTEPDSRNYIKVIDTTDLAKPIARLYVIGQDNTLSISGVLLIRGQCLARGQYYDATKLTVAMMKSLRLQELQDESSDHGEDIPSSSTSEIVVVDVERTQ